jgi:hypothetical protein
MAAKLPSATCKRAVRGAGCYGFPVASGDLHTLAAFGAEHVDMCSKTLDDGTAA